MISALFRECQADFVGSLGSAPWPNILHPRHLRRPRETERRAAFERVVSVPGDALRVQARSSGARLAVGDGPRHSPPVRFDAHAQALLSDEDGPGKLHL